MRKWATAYLATMKLVTNKETTLKLLAEILSEYRIYEKEGEEEANPFEGDPQDAAADATAEAEGEEKKDEKEKEAKPTAPAGIVVSFDISTVKKYNDAAFRSNQGVVKSINKDGLKIEVDGGTVIHVNFDSITNK